MRCAQRTLVAIALVLLGVSCDSAVQLQVEVSWDGFQAPTQLEQLHFQLYDADGLLVERSFEVPDDAPPAVVTLVPGTHTPNRLSLVVLGLRAGQIVTRSAAQNIDFEDATAPVRVDLP